MGLSQILESAFCYLQQSLFYYYFIIYIRSDRLLKGGENVKFIHTGDIHWGMSPDSDKPWSRERSRDIRDTFTAIIAKAKELRVDCLFIAGDLFHRQPLLRDLKEVNYLFSTIPQTRVVIIAGNHDRIRKNSAVLSFSWASNVTFLESEDVSSVYFEDINTEVTGFSYYTAEIPEPRLDALEAPEDGKIHILLGHGGDANHIPIDRTVLASSGFSYIALGHIHKPMKVGSETLRYCGTPMPYSLSEENQQKGILMVEMGAKGDVQTTVLPLHPVHQVRKLRATREALLSGASEDFVSICVMGAEATEMVGLRELLRAKYPNLLELRREREETVELAALQERTETLSPYELCLQFAGERLNAEEKALLTEVMNAMKEENA